MKSRERAQCAAVLTISTDEGRMRFCRPCRALLALATCIVCIVVVESKSEKKKLRGGRPFNDDSSLLCRMTVYETMYPSSEFHTSERDEQVSCIPFLDDGQESDDLFPVDLPDDLLDEHGEEVEQGRLLVSISNATVTAGGLNVQPNAKFRVVTGPPDRLRHLRRKSNVIEGNMAVAVIRISTTDSSPRQSAVELKRTLFKRKISFAKQFESCSFGKLKWNLKPDVIEVKVNQPVSDFKGGMALVQAAQKAIKADLVKKYNVESLNQLADKVIMCLPPGTGNWAASAGVNHWRIQMNNDWCTSLTATMHELGHSLGLLHSNANGKVYADKSGYMGAGTTRSRYPRKCFNGYHSYRLGWYKDRQTYWHPLIHKDRLINLATFVDYDKATNNEPVLVNIASNFYLQYNRAKSFNFETENKPNQVTITEPLHTGTESRAGLKVGERYEVENFRSTGKTLIIEACSKQNGQNGADIMVISVALDKSLCPKKAPPDNDRSSLLSWVHNMMNHK